MKINFRRLAGIGAIIIFLSGCATVPTREEKEERAKVSQVERIYREKVNLPGLSEESSLPEFIRYALLNNPKVEAAFYHWKEAVESIAVSRYLPNPQISFEAEITSSLESLMAGLMFMIPASNKIALQAEVFSLEAKEKRHIFEEQILKVAFQVKNISYQYWVLNQKIESLQKIFKTVEDLESLSLAKLKVGKVSPADLLSLQIEKEQISNMVSDLNDSQKVFLAQFKSALGVESEEVIPPPSQLPFTSEQISEEKIWQKVKEYNPRLALMRTEIIQSEIFVKQAYKDYAPDFALGLMKSFFSNMSLVKPLLTLSIPWRGRVAAQVAASQAGLKGAEAEYSAEELDLAVMLADASFRWRQADREVQLYQETLLPKAEDIFNLLEANYISGLSDLDEVLKAERVFLDFSFNYHSASGMREIALSEISALIAGALPEGETTFGF